MAIKDLMQVMTAARAAPADARPTEVLAALKGVHKRYGKLIALDGIDLEVRRGELLALLGPNGAGKSTAISLCLGLVQPDAGQVTLRGRSPLDIASRRSVGVMMQEAALTPELRVRELVELACSYYPQPLSWGGALQAAGAGSLASRPYGKLSGGQKRQVQFAIAICGCPELLFLDEPTVGLDVQAREAMWQAIRGLVAKGCSIVLTTHYLEEAESLADRVAVLAAGRLIASGTVSEIRSIVLRKQIRCSCDLSAAVVQEWPGVTQVNRELNHLYITALDAESIVRRLLAADPALSDLEVQRAGLAEAFTELTKEAA